MIINMYPFGGEGRSTDTEKGGLGLTCNALSCKKTKKIYCIYFNE